MNKKTALVHKEMYDHVVEKLDEANGHIKILEGVVDCVKERQEMLSTGKVIIQMFPSSMYPGDKTFHGEGESGNVLMKKIRAVERKMKKALAKLEESLADKAIRELGYSPADPKEKHDD